VSAITVGIALVPHPATLELLGAAIHELAQHWSLTPETLWRVEDSGTLVSNGFHAQFRRWHEARPRRCVAHGVGFSVGSPTREAARRAAWIERLRDDARVFGFEWITDHLGASRLGGRELTLPLPLLMTDASAAVVRTSLDELRAVAPDVGVENSVFYFHLGDPRDEGAFLRACLREPRSHLLLDVHNVYTTALNAGLDARELFEMLPLERVIEIHLSGGVDSDPRWLPGGATLRLDSHDDAVPEPVWELYELALRGCENLRAVTLERMEQTVEDEAEARTVEDELRRARRMLELVRG